MRRHLHENPVEVIHIFVCSIEGANLQIGTRVLKTREFCFVLEFAVDADDVNINSNFLCGNN